MLTTQQKKFLTLGPDFLRPAKVECTIRIYKETWKTEWTRCLKAECRNKGSQDHHQLDPDKIQEDNIFTFVFMMTDKIKKQNKICHPIYA